MAPASASTVTVTATRLPSPACVRARGRGPPRRSHRPRRLRAPHREDLRAWTSRSSPRRPSAKARNSTLRPRNVPLRIIVAASRPRLVSGNARSIMTAFPRTSGVNRMSGCLRSCERLRITPSAGQVSERTGLEDLSAVHGARLVLESAFRPAARADARLSSARHSGKSAAQLVHVSLPRVPAPDRLVAFVGKDARRRVRQPRPHDVLSRIYDALDSAFAELGE